MADKIIFPLDSESCLRKGRIFFEEGNEEEALKYIDKAYTLDNKIETNIFYTAVLVHYQRYPEALKIMQCEKKFYKDNENYASFYTEVLINSRHFLEAAYIIQKYKDNPSRIDTLAWEMLEQDLIQEQERFNFEISERRINVIKALRELEQHSPLTQVRKMKDAEILDLSELQGVASHVLISDDVVETVRRSFLEILIEKGDQNTYSFLWFDQIQKVSPATLPRFNEVELVHTINILLEKKLAKYPDLLVRVKIEILHDLLLLYPYVEETISDLNFWINSYINKLDFFNYIKTEQIAVTEEQKEMMKWINRLDVLSQREQIFSEE